MEERNKVMARLVFLQCIAMRRQVERHMMSIILLETGASISVTLTHKGICISGPLLEVEKTRPLMEAAGQAFDAESEWDEELQEQFDYWSDNAKAK